MSTFADLQRPSQVRGICRARGCDETTAGQLVMALRSAGKPSKTIASASASFCEPHAVELFEEMAALIGRRSAA